MPEPQFLPHVPQLVGSVCRLAHVAPQAVSPCGHAVTQAPCRQAVPTAQACPHWPQL